PRGPHLLALAFFVAGRAVEIPPPIRLVVGAEDVLGPAPPDAVVALDQGEAFLRPPREPHPVGVSLLENGDVEAGSETAAEDRVVGVLHPAGGSLGRRVGGW